MPGAALEKGKCCLEVVCDDDVPQEEWEYVAQDLLKTYPLVGAVEVRKESVPQRCG